MVAKVVIMPNGFDYNIVLIIDYLITNKMSRVNFCKECGITLYALNKVLKNETLIDLNIIKKIAKYLNVKTSDMFVVY